MTKLRPDQLHTTTLYTPPKTCTPKTSFFSRSQKDPASDPEATDRVEASQLASEHREGPHAPTVASLNQLSFRPPQRPVHPAAQAAARRLLHAHPRVQAERAERKVRLLLVRVAPHRGHQRLHALPAPISEFARSTYRPGQRCVIAHFF